MVSGTFRAFDRRPVETIPGDGICLDEVDASGGESTDNPESSRPADHPSGSEELPAWDWEKLDWF